MEDGWRRFSPWTRLRYSFDRALSRGPSVVIGWLVVLTFSIIVAAALILTIARLAGVNGEGRIGFGEAMWQSMLRVVDPGTFADDEGWLTRVLALTVTVAGIFIAGSLIGLIANAVDQRIELLGKGRSAVVERDHTLILGWSPRVPAIVGELVVANESRRKAAVVVLADVDKREMEETLRRAIDDWATTRLVCRSGDTSSFDDLALVNTADARSAIVVGESDASVAKSVLALHRCGADVPVVAEVRDPAAATSLRALFGDRIVIVHSDSVVAELTAQACRSRGLSEVFHDLLDFAGDEMYFAPFPELSGLTFRDAQLRFETSCLLGVLTADRALVLNPPGDLVVRPGDELIALASDDSTFVADGDGRPAPTPDMAALPGTDPAPRRIALVGWSELGPRVVAELDDFLGAETTLEILVDPTVAAIDDVRRLALADDLVVEVSAYSGRPEEVARIAADRTFDEVIVLGRRGGMTAEEADARTLLILLAFNKIADERGSDTRVVAELLEQRHTPLAEATGADDFIVSDELTSLMIAQVSERRELELVFRDLFDRGGNTIEMVRAERLGAADVTCFADVVVRASGAGLTALGVRSHRDGTVALNPRKHAPLQLHPADEIVVLRTSSRSAPNVAHLASPPASA